MVEPVDFVVVPGRGAASGVREFGSIGGTIAAQRPHFAARGLHLGVFHGGTLNLDIAPRRLRMRRPLFTARDLQWADDLPAENFDFASVIIAHAGMLVSGLIYYPRPETKLAHAPLVPENIVEVLAPFVPGIGYGSRGTIYPDRDQVDVD